ncbi:hypothetical protein BGZ94_002302 [Podila epigama]|nr:hypothetical protein BGZ94_002302 [Podila epigama]
MSQHHTTPENERKRAEVLMATGHILHERCQSKLKKLDELKARLAKKEATTLSATDTPSSDKRLEILLTEEKRLLWQVEQLKANKGAFTKELPEVTELRVRRTIQDTLHGYEVATPLLSRELDGVRQELAGENRTLKESLEIKDAFHARIADLAKTIEKGASQENSQGRQQLLEARRKVQELMQELTSFLSKHYPPVKSDESDSTVFQLKSVLEDIMNLSVTSPADPYITLERGTYYPPHIEQLINAGIAVRHPRDAQRIRLVDFYS